MFALCISFALVSLGCAASAPPPAAPVVAPTIEGDYAMTVDNLPLAYHVRGRGPLCIVHPGGPGLDWAYLRMPEVERRLTLVYLEPIGTGASSPLPSAKDYTLARYAALLDGVRAALGQPRACVLGHSHGGFVALHWAVAHPDKVSGLILYSTAGRMEKAVSEASEAAIDGFTKEPWFPQATAAWARFPNIVTNEDADAVIKAIVPIMFADWTNRQASYAPWLATVRAFAGPMRGEYANQDPWNLLRKLTSIRVPTLIIAGAKDASTPPFLSEELARAMPGSQLVVLPNSGHMGHVEEPAAFAVAIEELAAKLKP